MMGALSCAIKKPALGGLFCPCSVCPALHLRVPPQLNAPRGALSFLGPAAQAYAVICASRAAA